MMWYWGDATPWWGWMLMTLGMVVFWGLVIWGIWYVVTHAAAGTGPAPRGGRAEHILDERLARGEIDTDEYARLRDVLRGKETSATNGRSPSSSGVSQ
jgi:putative membrane protein